jgi:hypothetical protein
MHASRLPKKPLLPDSSPLNFLNSPLKCANSFMCKQEIPQRPMMDFQFRLNASQPSGVDMESPTR